MSTAVDDETILEVLRSNDAPRMTTTEVAGHLPVTRGTTRSRLQRLVDEDLLERKREGNNVVWWLPERADELDAWEAERATEPAEEGSAEAEPTEAESETDDPEDAAAEADEETDEPDPGADESDDTAVEVKATEQAKAETDDDDTEVEVEAVETEQGGASDEVEVTTPDDAAETRTAADRPDLSEDEEGLRALALMAAAVVVFLLFRKLLSGEEETEETG